MNNINEEKDFLLRLVNMLEMQLGKDSEIVLHDLTREYDSTIIAIANGELSGRKVGDSGTNLGLEVLRGKVQNGDRFNYITNGKDGKVFRSSSIYIYDDNGKVIGSICINTDITTSITLEKYFHDRNQIDIENDESNSEIFANNVNEILNFLLVQGQTKIKKSVADMTREDKVAFIKFLDDRGAFLISKASETIGKFLGISKYTLYQYLDMARKEHNAQKEEAE